MAAAEELSVYSSLSTFDQLQEKRVRLASLAGGWKSVVDFFVELETHRGCKKDGMDREPLDDQSIPTSWAKAGEDAARRNLRRTMPPNVIHVSLTDELLAAISYQLSPNVWAEGQAATSK